jgi:hypothetical protein
MLIIAGVLASGPTPGICKRKPCATLVKTLIIRFTPKLNKINLANEPLPIYKIL